MSPAEPLLILTDDDLLAEHWQALGRSPVRARRVGGEACCLVVGHRAALADQAAARAVGEAVVVGRVDGAAVPLGRHVQRDGPSDRGREDGGEPPGATALVAEVLVRLPVGHAALAQLQKMADVVEQGGGDERVVGPVAHGQGGRLQRVVQLGHVLVVALGAPPLEQVEHLVDVGGGHQTERPWKSLMSETWTLPSARPPSAVKRASFSA